MTDEERRNPFREVGVVYTSVLAAIIVFAVAAVFVPLINQLLYAIVAFLFFFVPQKILERERASPEEYGMVAGDVKRGLLWGFGATLVTLPFFLPGYWIWETQFLERELAVDVERYRQWSLELEGEPENWGADTAGVWIWSDRDELSVGIRNDGEANNRVTIEADEPFVPTKRGTVSLKPADGESRDGARKWIATLTHSSSRGVVTIRGPDDVRVTVAPITAGNRTWPMFRGPSASPVEDNEVSDSRGVGWLFLWVATQFVLVAFPEEYFYRGYVQTKLEKGFEERAARRGRTMRVVLGVTPAIVTTSLMFGIGHLLVPVGGALLANRMAVFFPSLVFGWLRRHTGSILAPTIYHAFSNMLVLVSAVHFV